MVPPETVSATVSCTELYRILYNVFVCSFSSLKIPEPVPCKQCELYRGKDEVEELGCPAQSPNLNPAE